MLRTPEGVAKDWTLASFSFSLLLSFSRTQTHTYVNAYVYLHIHTYITAHRVTRASTSPTSSRFFVSLLRLDVLFSFPLRLSFSSFRSHCPLANLSSTRRASWEAGRDSILGTRDRSPCRRDLVSLPAPCSRRSRPASSI